MTRDDGPFELVLTPPAVRAIRTSIPEAVVTAVLEFVTGVLLDNPYRAGKRLRGDLAGIHSARRGTYRVLYRIRADADVIVLRVEHHRDAYRPG